MNWIVAPVVLLWLLWSWRRSVWRTNETIGWVTIGLLLYITAISGLANGIFNAGP